MKAIVCDKCGKVTLLEDDKMEYNAEAGVFRLIVFYGNTLKLDLCKECTEELVAAVREQK